MGTKKEKSPQCPSKTFDFGVPDAQPLVFFRVASRGLVAWWETKVNFRTTRFLPLQGPLACSWSSPDGDSKGVAVLL